MVIWVAVQDGNKFYIQDNPEAETWVACFYSKTEADEYCDFLNEKEES